MRKRTRDALRVRYQYRCGYCGVEESDVGAELTIDHFQPRSQNGNDDSDSLGLLLQCLQSVQRRLLAAAKRRANSSSVA